MSTNERLEQIRTRLQKAELAPHAPDEWWGDMDFLLSELQAERSLGVMRNAMRESAEKECAELRAELKGKQQIIDELITAAKRWEDEAFRAQDAERERAAKIADERAKELRRMATATLLDEETVARLRSQSAVCNELAQTIRGSKQ